MSWTILSDDVSGSLYISYIFLNSVTTIGQSYQTTLFRGNHDSLFGKICTLLLHIYLNKFYIE